MKLIGILFVIFKKTTAQEPTKIEKRVATLATSDLASWADQALYGIGRYISSWQKSHDIADLKEAQIGAESLNAVLNELIKRVET
jgi:hypothetical protein